MSIKKIKFIFLLIIILTIIYLGYFFSLIYFSNNTNLNQERFVIESGQGVKQITSKLKQDGLIKNKFLFEVYIYLKKSEANFQVGEFYLRPGLGYKKIVQKLTSTTEAKEKQITLIEGWRVDDIGQYLEEQGLFSKKEFLELVGWPRINYNFNDDLSRPKDFSEDYDFLQDKPKNYGLEGYIFPDTYRIYQEASIEDIVRKSLDNFNTKLTSELRQEIKKQNRSIYEIITLASIIEKEVVRDEDRKIVAGIFYNRLNINMGLQADSTINYITGKQNTRSTIEDLEVDSLYNTYKYRGLPPGPICNPGLSSILAAIYPAETDYLYFLTTPEGEAIFSRNFEEHKINKAKYL
ncbi:MAG: endolytic transglycosylase MltG [Patescibacteria group bacterium]|nr:endolytic transglycosylase MltG [Patescibacteria group bacterium]